MQFSNTTTKEGILQQLEFRLNLGDAGITGDATLLKQFTGQINNAYMKATQIIISSDGVWNWDDTGYLNLAKATTDLVLNQSDYGVMATSPSSGQDWLEITGVNVKDESGQWYKLNYKADKFFGEPKQGRDTVSAQPNSFFFDGTQIFLDTKPSYSSTGGLEILFNRTPLQFLSTDTTKRPGFNTIFHEYLVLKPSYWWEKYKKVGNPEQTKRDIAEMERDIGKFYGNRGKYEAPILQRNPQSYK